MVKCNNNNSLKANPDHYTLKANSDDNTLKANPALCKTTTTIETIAQIMHKSDNNNNNNKDTSKVQYFATMHDCSCLLQTEQLLLTIFLPGLDDILVCHLLLALVVEA